MFGRAIRLTSRPIFWPSSTLTRIPGLTEASSPPCRFRRRETSAMSRTIAIFRQTRRILACGGLLSVLKGQNGIFFFDVTNARHPRFLMSTKALDSSITDDFFPLPEGGFLITQMGSATGGAPGRVAEFDGRLHFVANHFGRASLFEERPAEPPLDGFNPHGIDVRPDLNLMLTADFILPGSTLAGSSGPVLREHRARLGLQRP